MPRDLFRSRGFFYFCERDIIEKQVDATPGRVRPMIYVHGACGLLPGVWLKACGKKVLRNYAE